ncbi:MAG TPA: hypothetical protein VLL98_05100 [Rickettsiales bacterium]|nr:hypothetical protein [Rickettsiales bacterium]
MRKILSLFVIILILTSCGSVKKDREMRVSLATNIKAKNYEAATLIVKDKDFYEDKNSELLRNLERGTVYYLKGEYYQALKSFENAKKISDDLYTISISKKTASVWDENMDNYYGEKYERSMIRFYLSLINYNLYQQGFYEEYLDEKNLKVEKKILTDEEENFHLNYARSSIIEWDSLLKSYQGETGGEPVYKNDMLAKVWGGFIHGQFNTVEDRQVALQLYKDGNDVLLKNYNMYSTFNNKAKEFDDDFKKLPNLSFQELQKNYISETQYSKDLQEFLNREIRNLNSSKKDNLVIMVKDNLVAPKTVKTIKIPIPIAAFGSVDSNFEAMLRVAMLVEGGIPQAEIELPEIKITDDIKKYTAQIFDLNGNKVAETDLTMIEPMSDIAKKTLDDKLALIRTKIVARITTKYVAGAIAAYAVYRQGDWYQIMGLAMFAGSVKAANESSRADTRYWTSLFSNIQFGGAMLKQGKYKLVILSNDCNIYEKEIEIKKGQTTFIDLNY